MGAKYTKMIGFGKAALKVSVEYVRPRKLIAQIIELKKLAKVGEFNDVEIL